jgi:hypothetical protein
MFPEFAVKISAFEALGTFQPVTQNQAANHLNPQIRDRENLISRELRF